MRRKGRTPTSRSFRLKSEGLLWAREQELEADQSRPQVHKTLKGITVADIVSRYRDEVVPRKRGADRETLTLNAFLRHPLARVALSDVTTGMVSAYCAERLRRVKAGTLIRALRTLSRTNARLASGLCVSLELATGPRASEMSPRLNLAVTQL